MRDVLSLQGLLSANPGQFAGIQPIPSAIRALVHFHQAFGAEKMAFEFDTGAPRTIAFAMGIYFHAFVPFDVQQMPSGCFIFSIHFLQFKSIEPDASATALANVHLEIANLNFGQVVETGWTFHGGIMIQVYNPLCQGWRRMNRFRQTKSG